MDIGEKKDPQTGITVLIHSYYRELRHMGFGQRPYEEYQYQQCYNR